MGYSYPRYPDPLEAAEEKLYDARQAVLALLPPDLSGLAEAFRGCNDRREEAVWERQVIERLVASAWILSEADGVYQRDSQRAYCPLCRSGSSSAYEEGFAVPEGLTRHLTGNGNARQCVVTRTLFRYAHEVLSPKFRAADETAERERARILEERRTTEPQFRIGPLETRLLDEGLEGRERDATSLAWAVDRLAALGFAEECLGKVRTFGRRTGDHVVYADPRELGRLRFHVYRDDPKPQTARRRGGRGASPPVQSFEFKDTWRNELVKKLETRLDEASELLSRRGRRGGSRKRGTSP